MDFTQIQITKKTREKLKGLKLVKKESYDELINRMIDKEEKS